MRHFASLPVLAAVASAASSNTVTQINATDVCRTIARTVSSASAVYYPGSANYTSDIFHWYPSSTQQSACSVEPGTVADVARILVHVGATRTPFAVKSGGHTTNLGFSSTTGVHISMSRFNRVKYDSKTSTATIGAGLNWGQVYAALEPHGVNVAGGRVNFVGVGGYTLGGGYSFLGNEVGLAADTVTAYELVQPTGVVKQVTAESDPDLFFALKGGSNNYGVVTRFTFKAYPQGQVWGGTRYITSDYFNVTLPAISSFSENNKDPKANILVSISNVNGYIGVPPGGFIIVQLFYNGPTPPKGIFDDLLTIPSFNEDLKTRSFVDFMSVNDADIPDLRTSFNTVGIESYTEDFLETVLNETLFWSTKLTPYGLVFISYAIEPFLPSLLSHTSLPSAYPPSRDVVYRPTNILFSWVNATVDDVMLDAIRSSKKTLDAAAAKQGQDLSRTAIYNNYALAGTPIEGFYGKNIPRLRQIRKRVDPFNVMALAGGWKL